MSSTRISAKTVGAVYKQIDQVNEELTVLQRELRVRGFTVPSIYITTLDSADCFDNAERLHNAVQELRFLTSARDMFKRKLNAPLVEIR